MNIYLIGLSGSGKSTVGPKLAQKLKLNFVDSDAMIEKKQRKTISNIFKTQGEKSFRIYEFETITKIINDNRSSVAALGGGAFQSAHNRKKLKDSGYTVYLSCAKTEIYKRLKSHTDRPLLNSGQPISRIAFLAKLGQLLEKRRGNYKKADIIVLTTSKTINQTVNEIIKKLKRLDANS